MLMRRFLLWCLTKKRSFRVSILTLFLSLFLVSFTLILTFTYTKDYKEMLFLSNSIADELARHLRYHFFVISSDAEETTQISTAFFPTIGPLTVENPILRSYFLNKLVRDPYFANLYIGFPNGDLVEALNIYNPSDHTFFLDPTRALPENISYGLRFVNRQVDPPVDIFEYIDRNLTTVAKEVIPHTSFIATDRPWYKGAVNHRSSFWTNVYEFQPGWQRGISIGTPMIDGEGNIIAVVGADLSLNLLARILQELRVGKAGKTLILDEKGDLVIPNTSDLITRELVAITYDYYQATPSRKSHVVQYKGTSFLTFNTEVSNFFGAPWSVLVITPLDNFLSNLIHSQHQIIILISIITLVAIFIIVRFATRISQPITTLATEIEKIKDLDLSSHIRIRSSIHEIYRLDQAIAAMRYVVLSFSKYIPREVVKNLFLLHKDILLGGEKKEITIFFSDVANFTSIAESEEIDVLLPLVTEYFHAMTDIILKQEGTIDKFIGDGIMAFWGAPIEIKSHAQKACDAALLCHAMLIPFNANRKKQGKPEFPTRFGIHSGEVIVGNIGTENRMNYTVLGDAVNTTARLQEVDKLYHTSIIISEQVYKYLPSEYIARPLDLVTVKGKKKKIKIYELIGKQGSFAEIEPSFDQIELCKLFTNAYILMEENKKAEALSLFSLIAQKFPLDFPTKIYLERLRNGSN